MIKDITDETIEALTRNFYKEAASYGFRYEHYLKFVNTLLDLALEKNGKIEIKPESIVVTDASMNHELPIQGRNTIIREYNAKEDFGLLEKWLKDEYGRYFMHSLITSNRLTLEDLLNDSRNIVGIITKTDNIPIGVMAFLNYDKQQKKAELRKLIGEPQLRGKGLGKEATKIWISYGRNFLKLRKIYLYTVDTNIRNIKLNEELGFKVEGILRNELVIDKITSDVLRMGLVFHSDDVK
ncbi:MAG: GNAT family N-acetyltransferase [Melioribacteraceae bacterium]|nr:GNAT family N-acetyltransferase [Melioribacteraceae bacterium]